MAAIKRVVSLMVRSNQGQIQTVVDRQQIDCDDEGAGYKALAKQHQEAGAQTTIVLAQDDSQLLHWTKPQ